jgi:hypothetical protein
MRLFKIQCNSIESGYHDEVRAGLALLVAL